MRDLSKDVYEAAQRVLEEAGMDFRAPWQCDLDDVEHGRFEALGNALHAAIAQWIEEQL